MEKAGGRIAGLLLISLLLTGCERGVDPEATPERSLTRPNIVLVVLDTVRRDRLSLYGYEKKTTPFLKKLARSSRLYTNAYSTSSWTVPAHASLFTGLFPITHGATQENQHLDDAHVTLAEHLSGAGYRTFAINENAMISKQFGFAQGFDTYLEHFRYRKEVEKINVLQSFGKLVQHEDDRPFFAFVNLLTAHAPYCYNGPQAKHLRAPILPKSEDGTRRRFSSARFRWHGFYGGYQPISTPLFDHLSDLYDFCISSLDNRVKKIVTQLKEADAWENTVFVLTADHGENLGDHGHYEHVFSLYQPTIRIPLLIHYPEEFARGSQDSRPVQLTDIVPTVMSLIELDGDFPGRDLRDPGFDESRDIFAEYYLPRQAFEVLEGRMRKQSDSFWEEAREDLEEKYLRRLRVVLRNNLKLIRYDDGSVELYDLSLDPEELINRAHEAVYAERRAQLEQALVKFGTREIEAMKGEVPTLDAETEAELRALGYIN